MSKRQQRASVPKKTSYTTEATPVSTKERNMGTQESFIFIWNKLQELENKIELGNNTELNTSFDASQYNETIESITRDIINIDLKITEIQTAMANAAHMVEVEAKLADAHTMLMSVQANNISLHNKVDKLENAKV
jgi:hypothetical protein